MKQFLYQARKCEKGKIFSIKTVNEQKRARKRMDDSINTHTHTHKTIRFEKRRREVE
jgi:hypothetical protein